MSLETPSLKMAPGYHGTDPDQYAASIASVAKEIIAVDAGAFDAAVSRVDLGSIVLERGSSNLAHLSRIRVAPDRAVVTFLQPGNAGCLRGTVTTTPSNLLLINAGHNLSWRFLGRSEWGAISMPADTYAAAAGALVGGAAERAGPMLVREPSEALRSRVGAIHASAMGLAASDPVVFASPDVRRGLERALIETVIVAMSSGLAPAPQGCASHQAMLTRFDRIIEARPDEALFMQDVCEALGVPGRTLRVVCAKYFGLSPYAYLHLRRMHLARRALLETTDAATTVTSVAMRLGFWELGRFSVVYRKMFGESPVTTLRARLARIGLSEPLAAARRNGFSRSGSARRGVVAGGLDQLPALQQPISRISLASTPDHDSNAW